MLNEQKGLSVDLGQHAHNRMLRLLNTFRGFINLPHRTWLKFEAMLYHPTHVYIQEKSRIQPDDGEDQPVFIETPVSLFQP